MSHDNKQDDNLGVWLFGAGLLVGVMAAYVHSRSTHTEMASRPYVKGDAALSISSPAMLPIDRMNRDLKDADTKQLLNEQMIEDQNLSAPPVHDESTGNEANESTPTPLIFDQENPGKHAGGDHDKSKYSQKLTPDERISAKLERDAWLKEYEKKYNAEYVRQFLKNAKENGVDVRLNKDLDVTGLAEDPVEQPIRVPQSESPVPILPSGQQGLPASGK